MRRYLNWVGDIPRCSTYVLNDIRRYCVIFVDTVLWTGWWFSVKNGYNRILFVVLYIGTLAASRGTNNFCYLTELDKVEIARGGRNVRVKYVTEKGGETDWEARDANIAPCFRSSPSSSCMRSARRNLKVLGLQRTVNSRIWLSRKN